MVRDLATLTDTVPPAHSTAADQRTTIGAAHLAKFTTSGGRLLSLRNLLRGADKALGLYDRHHLKSLRARALGQCESWLLENQDANGSPAQLSTLSAKFRLGRG